MTTATKRTPRREIMVQMDAATLSEHADLVARPIEEVWLEYQRTGNKRIRNYLVVKYLYAVKFMAERMRSKLPDEIDIDDLRSNGVFGLVDAIDSFDLSRNIKFETFCAPRIRGAMLDGLRSMDWVPRLVRSRTAKLETIRRTFEMKHGRQPTSDELASHFNLSKDEFGRIQRDSAPTSVISLDKARYENDANKDIREVDKYVDARQLDPLSVVQRRDLRELISKGLTRSERLIIILYYYESMTMREIGLTLDLSESRVSQMHTGILGRLRAQLHNREDEFSETEE